MFKCNNRCCKYIQLFNDIRIHQACLLLQNYCYEHNLLPSFDFFRELLLTISENDKLLRPLILMNIAYTGEFKFLEDLNLDIFVVKALSQSSEQLKLIEILDHSNNYEPSIIEVVLINLKVKYDCSEFLDSDNEDIQFAALQYYARNESELERIIGAIERGKRLNFLLSLLRYFPFESFDLIKTKGLNGSKAERQTILKVLKNIDYKKNYKVIESVLQLLDKISSKDRIWHIRRDARELKIKIIHLTNPR